MLASCDTLPRHILRLYYKDYYKLCERDGDRRIMEIFYYHLPRAREMLKGETIYDYEREKLYSCADV